MNNTITNLFILMMVSQIGYSINPMKEYKMKPDQFKIDYQEIKIKTEDGYELNTWIMNPNEKNDSGITFIIVGSDAGNMGYSLPYAFQLLRRGFKVITFDYRGFGGSSDFDYNPNNYYHNEYVKDFTTVLKWIKEEEQANKIGVLSFSMGTLISTIGYDEYKYDFLIGEGFIYSPKKNVRRIKKLNDKRLNLPKEIKCNKKIIERMEIPILIFSSKSDKITTLKDSLRIGKKNPKVIIKEYEGDHLKGAISLGMKEYFDEIEEMIK